MNIGVRVVRINLEGTHAVRLDTTFHGTGYVDLQWFNSRVSITDMVEQLNGGLLVSTGNQVVRLLGANAPSPGALGLQSLSQFIPKATTQPTSRSTSVR